MVYQGYLGTEMRNPNAVRDIRLSQGDSLVCGGP